MQWQLKVLRADNWQNKSTEMQSKHIGNTAEKLLCCKKHHLVMLHCIFKQCKYFEGCLYSCTYMKFPFVSRLAWKIYFRKGKTVVLQFQNYLVRRLHKFKLIYYMKQLYGGWRKYKKEQKSSFVFNNINAWVQQHLQDGLWDLFACECNIT